MEDLPLLCERHATSKLQQFDDLASIATLGFRGEALASMSFSAHLSVTTMVRNAAHGHQVSYRYLCTGSWPCRTAVMPCCSPLGTSDMQAARLDNCFSALFCPVEASSCGLPLLSQGCLPQQPQQGLHLTCRDGVMDAAGPQPCAALPGTTITVQDLFFNMPIRRKVSMGVGSGPAEESCACPCLYLAPRHVPSASSTRSAMLAGPKADARVQVHVLIGRYLIAKQARKSSLIIGAVLSRCLSAAGSSELG